MVNELINNADGTKVYILDDGGLGGDKAIGYAPCEIPVTTETFDSEGKLQEATLECPNYKFHRLPGQQHINDYHIPGTQGYNENWPHEGTNNSDVFRNKVLSWFNW